MQIWTPPKQKIIAPGHPMFDRKMSAMPGVLHLMGAGPQIGAPTQKYDDVILAETSLTHYYPCKESSGSILDAKGSTNGTAGTITYSVASILPTSDGLTCIQTNGTSGSIVTWASSLQGAFPFSIELWFQFGSINNTLNPIFLLGTSGGGISIQFIPTSAGGPAVRLEDSSFNQMVFTTANFATNTTYHFVVSATNSTTASLYVQAVSQTLSTGATLVTPNGAGSILSGDTGMFNHYANSKAEKIAIYNAAISGAQVLAHYNKGLNG